MKTVLVVPAASCRPCAYNQVDKSSLWCTNSTQAGSYLGLGDQDGSSCLKVCLLNASRSTRHFGMICLTAIFGFVGSAGRDSVI